MAGNCGYDPLARLCRRANDRGGGYIWLDSGDGLRRPCLCRPERPCAGRPDGCGCAPPERPCRPPMNGCAWTQRPFWPCWNTDELLEEHRPRICCQKCGCCDRLERQGRFVRCCACGWIGMLEECLCACRCMRSCCDDLLWPHRPGEPR